MTISDYSYRYTQNEAACCFLYYFFMFINFLFCCVRLGRVLVMVLDRRPTSRGFDCPPPLYRVHPPGGQDVRTHMPLSTSVIGTSQWAVMLAATGR